MVKSTISPFLENGATDAGRNGPPGSDARYSSQIFQALPHSAPVVRTSVLASVVPKLRRLESRDDMLTQQKSPLLTLTLSSPSFLDSVVHDDFSDVPLYVIKTLGPSSTIERADLRGEVYPRTTTANIEWPKAVPASSKGVSDETLIQLRGARWKGCESLLRRGTLPGSPRKFNIPNYSHTMKWKRVGTSYWCITTAVKGPVAIFEPSIASLPARLVIFETLHDRYDARPMLVHHGVSLLLLDYLLITSMIMVTDVQEWMTLSKHEGKDIIISPIDVDSSVPAVPKSAPSHISTSASQWRKIMFGEPLYRKRSSSRSSISSISTTADDVPPTPTSADEITALFYDQIRDASASDTSSASGGDDDPVFFSPVRTRPPSPSSESISYPLTPSSAPSHTYLDPSFYGEFPIPPVHSIPDWHNTPNSSLLFNPDSRCSSEHSVSSSKQRRMLPMPPALPSISRPRSTPPRAMTSPINDRGLLATPGTSGWLNSIPRLPGPERDSALPRGALRRLPRPPSTHHLGRTQSHAPYGRSRSHSQSMQPTEKWQPQYRQRTLPLPPGSSSAGSVGPSQEFRRGIQKESDNDLAEWVHVLTSPTPSEYPPGPLPQRIFDMPPPAYGSIEFHGRLKPQSPPPPLPPTANF